MLYFSFFVKGGLNQQAIKDTSWDEAFSRAIDMAAGEDNLYGFREVDLGTYRDILLSW